jgi:hypothetical protein
MAQNFTPEYSGNNNIDNNTVQLSAILAQYSQRVIILEAQIKALQTRVTALETEA